MLDLDKIGKPKTTLKRSKLGCINCKKRKKKCDEIKPICTGCLNRNIICEYKLINNEIHFNNKNMNNQNNFQKNNTDSNHNNSTSSDHDNYSQYLEANKIKKISSLRDVVGDTVMNILENNYSNLSSLFDNLNDKNDKINLDSIPLDIDDINTKITSIDDLFPIDSDFLNIIFEDQPEFISIFTKSNNSPSSIPKSLEIKLPVALTKDELSYFEFYCRNVLPTLSILPQEFNYYSKIYIPIAFKEVPVLYTLVGWGCRMRKNLNLNFQIENKEADKYVSEVNEIILKNEIDLDREKFITNFVCYMLLVCMEISFGDTSKWSHYFTCCFNMINKMPGNFRYLLSACSVEGNLLAENFAYFDVLASQSNENGTFYPMSDYHELFSQNNTTKIVHDPLQGCIRPLILLIGEIVSMLVEFSSLQISLDLTECDKFEIISNLMKKSDSLDRSIKFSKPDLSSLQYVNSSEELESHLTLFEVYQLSSQIYLKQVIRKLPPVVPEIQVLAYNLKEDLKILIKSETLKHSLAFPMLLLGITSSSNDDRKEVHKMFKCLIQTCGYLSSYQKLLIVIQKLWDLNDNGSLYVDWFMITKQLGWRLNLGR